MEETPFARKRRLIKELQKPKNKGKRSKKKHSSLRPRTTEKKLNRVNDGGQFGYLGKPEVTYSEEDAKSLCEGLIKWLETPTNVWWKYYFASQGILPDTVWNLRLRFPFVKDYLAIAKTMQEAKLAQMPLTKEIDGNHARFTLQSKHKNWGAKEETPATPTLDQVKKGIVNGDISQQ